MDYLVPALIVVVVGAIVGGGAWWLSRRASSPTPGSGAAGERPRGRRSLAGRVSSESARVASGRLDQESHREIYRLIAAGRTSDAVMAYRQSTGLGTFESMLDVQALATYPQMWVRPEPAPNPAPAPGPTGQPQASPEQDRPLEPQEPGAEEVPDTTNLVVPQDWLTESLPADRPFELEVVRDETTVRVSSADLPPFLRDQLTAMVRDGRMEEAALELSAHTVLTADESLQFLQILQREQGQDD
ncbi:MAG: hypothetical protein MOP51_76 [Citricoccus sp.]|jgi:hypothetical protein|nr:hypothetical protein [Citricoccus sp. WCRC_4]